jgi:hypothetical protein
MFRLFPFSGRAHHVRQFYGHSRHALVRPSLVFAAVVTILIAAKPASADTLGARVQAVSTDLGNGFGYALTTGGYVLGGIALLTGVYVLWKHQQNANGPHKLGYGITSIIVGGAFLSITYLAGYATHTVSDTGPDNTGTAAQMRFDN